MNAHVTIAQTEAGHPEQASLFGAPTVEVPRGVYARLTWRF